MIISPYWYCLNYYLKQKPFGVASFYSHGAYDIEWEVIGLLQNYFYGWPDNVIITYSKKLGHAGDVDE